MAVSSPASMRKPRSSSIRWSSITASGAYLWDKDGNRYIDILNGYGAILYGHSPDFVVEAVRKQLDLGFAIGPQTELSGVCAELISELTGMQRVTFCNTGSEAVMGAMRLARTVTGRNLVVLFTGDYHGSFDEVLVEVGRQTALDAGRTRHSARKRREHPRARLRHAGEPRDHPPARRRNRRSAGRAGAEPPSRASPRRVSARGAHDHRTERLLPHLRRSGHRLPHPLRRHAGALRHPRRPRDLRKGRCRRPPSRCPGRKPSLHGRPRRRSVAVWRRLLPAGRRYLLRRNLHAPSAGPGSGSRQP